MAFKDGLKFGAGFTIAFNILMFAFWFILVPQLMRGAD